MKRIFIFFLLFCSSLQSQIYNFKQNESLYGASVKGEDKYLFIIKSLTDTYTQNIEEYILYVNGQRKSSFMEIACYSMRENGNYFVIGRKSGEVSNVFSVLYGGKEKIYDSVERINEASNGESALAFMRLVGKGYALFIDTDIKEAAEYSELYASAISKNGSHYAFSIKREDKYYIVIDGQEREVEGEVNKIILSEDGLKAAYTIKSEGLYFIAMDEKKFGPYSDISSFAVSPNNQYLAYAAIGAPEAMTNMEENITAGKEAKSGEKYVLSKVAYGNKVEFGIAEINENAMPENNSIAANKDFQVIMNEREYQKYERISDMSFSPDSKTLAFIAEKDKMFYMVSGGNASMPYKKIEYYMFSKDSSALAFYADKNLVINSKVFVKNTNMPSLYHISKDTAVYEALKYNRCIIAADGYESALYDKIISFLYDNNKYTFTASRGGKYYIVNTKREEKGPYSAVSKQSKTEKGYIAAASDDESVYIVLSE